MSNNFDFLNRIHIAQKDEKIFRQNINYLYTSAIQHGTKATRNHHFKLNNNYILRECKLNVLFNYSNALNELQIFTLPYIDASISNGKKSLNILEQICFYYLHEKEVNNHKTHYDLREMVLPKTLVKCFEHKQLTRLKTKTTLIKIPYTKSLIIIDKPYVLYNICTSKTS